MTYEMGEEAADGSVAVAALMEHALVRDSTSELHAAALEALLEIAAADPPEFASHYRHRVTYMQGFLGHVDAAGLCTMRIP